LDSIPVLKDQGQIVGWIQNRHQYGGPSDGDDTGRHKKVEIMISHLRWLTTMMRFFVMPFSPVGIRLRQQHQGRTRSGNCGLFDGKKFHSPILGLRGQ
jgi:hypothetical protein